MYTEFNCLAHICKVVFNRIYYFRQFMGERAAIGVTEDDCLSTPVYGAFKGLERIFPVIFKAVEKVFRIIEEMINTGTEKSQCISDNL